MSFPPVDRSTLANGSTPPKGRVAAVRRAPTRSDWAERRRSGIHGWGMFATRAIPAGTRIIEYVGVKISKAEGRRREDARISRRERGGAGHVWIFDLNKRQDLDGDFAWNTARHINHSCEPNCESQQVRGRIWVVALRDIAVGEELSFDYGFPYDTWREHPCLCGARTCVGYIVNKMQRWRVRRILSRERRQKPRVA